MQPVMLKTRPDRIVESDMCPRDTTTFSGVCEHVCGSSSFVSGNPKDDATADVGRLLRAAILGAAAMTASCRGFTT